MNGLLFRSRSSGDPQELLAHVDSIPGSKREYKAVLNTSNLEPERIYLEDRIADLFVVLDGFVALKLLDIESSVIYDFRGRGDLFGNITGQERYTETAFPLALSGARVQRVDRTEFIKRGFLPHIERGFSDEKARLLEMCKDLALKTTAHVRLIKALLYIARRFHDQIVDPRNPEWVNAPFRMQELADFIAAKRPSVSKSINNLTNEELLHVNTQRISFKPELLEDHYNQIERARMNGDRDEP